MSATPQTGYERLTPALAECVDAVCDRFEQAWRAGHRPTIETHLSELPEPARSVLVRELILVESQYRRQAGEMPRPDDFQGRFPSLDRGWLDRVFAADAGAVPANCPTLPHDTSKKAPPPSDVPGYELLGELGHGGMGVVYKARDTRLGRLVALKFLTVASARDARHLERFRREARAACALNHPAVCTLYDLGEIQDRPYLVLELVEGQTLRALVGPCPDLRRVVPLIRQVAGALRSAHAAGIVHRDIKPENLMVRDDGYVKVLDFGLARLLPGGAALGPANPDADTDPGTLLGTISYMSPEQARAEPVGSATDIFSLGIVLYELTTGRHPFQAGDRLDTLHAIATEPPLSPARLNPEIPAPLDALIRQMLAAEPRLRPTAAEVEAMLGELAGHGSGPSPARVAPDEPRMFVGRGPERAALDASLAAAAAGQGLFLCVAGEPGIGKTTLIDDFLSQTAGGDNGCRIARGRCSERLGGAEAYLPVLEALDSLLASEAGEAAARALRLLAPSWYPQVVPVNGERPGPAEGCPQERRKREFLTFVQEVSRLRPLILFLDDVHWADESTVDLLAYLGARCAGLRLLVVLTYRPTELLVGPHAFVPVQMELQRHGACREIALGFFDPPEVEHYLTLAFPGHVFPPEFATLVHARTEGNPLFVADLLRYLRDRGVITRGSQGWTLARAVPDFRSDLPDSVRGLIGRKLALLGKADFRLLLAAAVQGPEFDSAVVARVLDLDPADVEERLEALDRVHGLVRLRREHEYPDGTLTLRYQFVHGLYQNVLYAALQPTRKASWSGAAAGALLNAYGENSAAVAGELALLFEAARQPEQAIECFLQAARNAVRVGAHRDAAGLARRGLTLLPKLPGTADRGHHELTLLLALGVSLVATKGFASPDVEQTYLRARDLCQRADDLAALFPVLYGLWNVYLLRSDLARCKDLAEQMFSLAQAQSDPIVLLQAHNVMQQPLMHLGEFAAARQHQERAWALYDAKRHRTLTAVYGEDPGVGCLLYGAVTQWFLGYPDRALRSIHDARQLADELAHPFNVARALYFGAFVRLCRREVGPVQDLAGELLTLAREQGYALLSEGALILRGWSLVHQGRTADGIRLMRQGLAGWQATGAWSHYPYHLALLAESLGRDGQADDGLDTVAEALARCSRLEERFYEAELYRIRGELLLQRAPTDTPAAEASFRHAADVARRQGAKTLELRAASSLARLLRCQGRFEECRPLLAEVYGGLSEGSDTPDLQDARALLDGGT